MKGYICPTCSREYDPLYVSHLFNPSQGTFTCEDDKTELIDHDPAAFSVGGQEKMQAFNISTQPIRDSLKRLEGLTLPSLNIMAWIAQNVVTEVVGVDSAEGDQKKVTVIIGGEEKDQLEKERLQEAQRYVRPAKRKLMVKSAKRPTCMAHSFDSHWICYDTRTPTPSASAGTAGQGLQERRSGSRWG